MSKVDFRLNLKGLNELMRGPEMQSVLSSYGANVLNAANGMAGDGAEFGMDTKAIRWIAVTTVRADNRAAIKENLEKNVLLKALGGGGA